MEKQVVGTVYILTGKDIITNDTKIVGVFANQNTSLLELDRYSEEHPYEFCYVVEHPVWQRCE